MRVISSILLGLLICAAAYTEDLGPRQIALRTVQNDLSVRRSELSLEIAYRSYLSARAGAGAHITLGTPGGKKTYGFSTTTGSSESVHTLGARINYGQRTAAGGSAKASIANTVEIANADAGSTYSLSPSASFSYSQPLFVGGKLIEPELTGSSYKEAELSYRRAESKAIDERNNAVLASIRLYVDVVELRSKISVLEEEVSLQRERVRQLRVTQQQGRTPLADVWEAEIKLQEKEDNLFEQSQTLRIKEQALSSRIGAKSPFDADSLSAELPEIDLDEEAVRAAAMEHQLADEAIGISIEEFRAIRGQEQFAPQVTASISLVPKRPNGFTGTSIGDSLQAFGDDETELAVDAGFTVTVPLYRGGRKQHEQRLSNAKIERARLTYRRNETAVVESLDSSFLEARLLAERVDYYARNIELAQRRLDEAQRLFDFQSATELDVRSARIALQDRQSQLWRIRANLLINQLSILSLSGVDLVEALSESA